MLDLVTVDWNSSAGCRRWSWMLAALVLLFLLPRSHGDEVKGPKEKLDAGPAPPLRTDYPETYRAVFEGNKGEVAGLVIYGPDVSGCVKFEPLGVRITLPDTYPRQRTGTGVVTDFGVRGDFEITVAYEILEGPKPGVTGNPTGLKLVVVPNDPVTAGMWHRSSQNRASLFRVASGANSIGRFVAEATTWNNQEVPRDQWGNEKFDTIELRAHQRTRAVEPVGRLRLVRNGSTLYFLTSEGPDKDFTLLHQSDFGTRDLKNVRVLGTTGYLGASLDVIVTDVQIRAEAFPKEATANLQPGPEATEEGNWLRIVVLLSALTLMSGVTLGVWLYARARQRSKPAVSSTPIAPALAFACPDCGKRLKARSELAGKKLKCPGCGKEVIVPSIQPATQEELS